MIDLILDYILFVIGLGLLLVSAELMVRNSTKVASFIGKSSLFIGLTVTAFGTSAPELALGISDQLNYDGNIGMGNIVGSNIFNVFIVLGVSAVIRPIIVHKPVVFRDIPILLIVTTFFFLLALDNNIGSFDTILLVTLLLGYFYYLAKVSNNPNIDKIKSDKKTKINVINSKLFLALFLIISSIVVMIAGAQIMVNSAVNIAADMGISEMVIGLTIVAIGTSLPELVTSVAAIRNDEHELAVGNVMGSCLFNIVAVPAAMSLVGVDGLRVSSITLDVDLPIMLLSVIVCLPIFFSGHQISRYEGILFLFYYSIFNVILYARSNSDYFIMHYQNKLMAFGIIVFLLTVVIITFRAISYYNYIKEEKI